MNPWSLGLASDPSEDAQPPPCVSGTQLTHICTIHRGRVSRESFPPKSWQEIQENISVSGLHKHTLDIF